ncbi:hypothetical protein [Zooshikella ganghwensis]|uniref:hypothetical protein n=1 Tax=Zooshikella ganghwensis TaxID=202772 RepID=UPI000482A81B|nr:hypothetical protein [Zooshikella ganghwensis]
MDNEKIRQVTRTVLKSHDKDTEEFKKRMDETFEEADSKRREPLEAMKEIKALMLELRNDVGIVKQDISDLKRIVISSTPSRQS